jgi:multidrug resistance efflux pump
MKLEADMNLQDTGKGQLYTYFPAIFKEAGLKHWPVGETVHLTYDTDRDEITIRRKSE